MIVSKSHSQLLTEQDIWDTNVEIPDNGRSNPFNLDLNDLKNYVDQGQSHSHIYPVSTSGLFLPKKLNEAVFSKGENPGLLSKILLRLKSLSPFSNFDSLFSWIGLPPYQNTHELSPYKISVSDAALQEMLVGAPKRLGYGYSEINGVKVATLSCATCHSGNLFGRTILGLSNRQTRANEFFYHAKSSRHPVLVYKSPILPPVFHFCGF